MTSSVADPASGYPPLLQAYLDARYRNERGSGEWQVGQYHDGPLPRPGSVHAQISACNPGSVPLGDAENRQRTQRLALALAQLHGQTWAAVSASPEGEWQEPGFWVENITTDLLDQLADEFGQIACLVVDADAAIRLRLYLSAWQRFADNDPRLQGLS